MKPLADRQFWLLLCLISLLAIAFAGFAAACGGDDDPQPTAIPSGSPSVANVQTATAEPVEGDITVFAASSLTDAFKEAATKFKERHPKANIVFNFAASSALSTQINEGAPADVFASADSAQMKVVTDENNAANPVIFATNLPVVVVPKSSTKVALFADLAKAGVKLVLAGPDVPIGRYSRDVFTNASAAGGGISADFSEKALANLVSNEANVRAVLTKVQLGEADAGIVYGTDAAIAAAGVKVIEIPANYNIITQYPIASISDAKNAAGAKAWVQYLLSADGQAILAEYGFGKPPAR